MNNGGPAFPKALDPYPNMQGSAGQSTQNGMSLRDYFAGQAIAAIPQRGWDHLGEEKDIIAAWAQCAYAVADAMLLARSPQESGQ